jgi:uncharacterized paraquat-inducible protein A
MKKILLTFACLLLLFVAWVFPYIDELRDQGLTLETAYGYFFGGPDHPFNPMMQFLSSIIPRKAPGHLCPQLKMKLI